MLLLPGNVLPAYFDAILRLQQVLAITGARGRLPPLSRIALWQRGPSAIDGRGGGMGQALGRRLTFALGFC